MNIKIKIIALILILFPVSSVLAADPVGINGGFDQVKTIQGQSGVKDGDIVTIIRTALKAGLAIVPIIAVAVLIGAGVMYITALGDEKKTERAKMVILYTVIGIIVIGLAGMIANFAISLIAA